MESLGRAITDCTKERNNRSSLREGGWHFYHHKKTEKNFEFTFSVKALPQNIEKRWLFTLFRRALISKNVIWKKYLIF